MALKKPRSIANSESKSQKWDEITSVQNFIESNKLNGAPLFFVSKFGCKLHKTLLLK